MIICSCNLLTDTQVRSAVASGATPPRMSHVYASLGCTAQCGRCVRTIKAFLSESTTLSDAWNHNSMIEGVRRARVEKEDLVPANAAIEN